MNISTRATDLKSPFNLPNALTWLRIIMVPAIIVLFYLPYAWADPAACAGFALAGITDSLDGYYARKWHQTSRLGAFLDPVADKLIVAAALVLIVSKDPRWFVVLMAIVIIGREIAVSALREWMAEIGARGKSGEASWSAALYRSKLAWQSEPQTKDEAAIFLQARIVHTAGADAFRAVTGTSARRCGGLAPACQRRITPTNV